MHRTQRVTSIGTSALLAVMVCACGTSTRPPPAPPVNVRALESNAEDVIDQIDAGRWARAAASSDRIRRTWNGYRDRAPLRDGEAATVNDAVSELSAAVDRRDSIAADQAGNAVSRVIVELIAREHPVPPVQVGRLDVIGRQLLIDSRRADVAAIARDAADARREYEAIEAAVNERGAPTATRAAAIIRSIDAAEASGSLDAAGHAARRLLAVVDRIERLWR